MLVAGIVVFDLRFASDLEDPSPTRSLGRSLRSGSDPTYASSSKAPRRRARSAVPVIRCGRRPCCYTVLQVLR